MKLSLTFNLEANADELAQVLDLEPTNSVLTLLQQMNAQLARLERYAMNNEEKLQELETELTELTTVTEGAVTLIDTLADSVEAAKDDPEQIQRVIDGARANKQRLANAIVARTPVSNENPTA